MTILSNGCLASIDSLTWSELRSRTPHHGVNMTLPAEIKTSTGNKIKRVEDYRGVARDEVLDSIQSKAAALSESTLVHVNATSFGGGVAEILDNFVLLMNDLGIRTDWRVLHGTPDFFEVTKKFHNALQGKEDEFSEEELELYRFTNYKFAQFAQLDHDFVIIHDPQPCALVEYVPNNGRWVWRCHIDITHPNRQAWEFMAPFVDQYERMIVSSEIYKNREVTLPQRIITPSIDPLSAKNMALDDATIENYLMEYRIPTDKPIITQVSRFDPWKDPEGVLKVYEIVRQEVDCRLAFVYNMASDDPEGVRIYEQMAVTAGPMLDAGDVLFIRGDDPYLVNMMQRKSDVILQKSTREGFGMVVTEAMWKETPVVASNVGGIPVQIQDGVTGFLVDPFDYQGFASRVVNLLQDQDLSQQIGSQAREYVREHFLITTHLLAYLDLMLSL
jgi:trehalose synthase